MADMPRWAARATVRVLGRRERLPMRDAALANGILIHGLDFDDTHMSSIVHATAASLPCALSLAEALDLHGRDLLTAYAAGMEVAIRLGAAVKGGFHHAGFHATGVVSHFSAAIVAGKLWGSRKISSSRPRGSPPAPRQACKSSSRKAPGRNASIRVGAPSPASPRRTSHNTASSVRAGPTRASSACSRRICRRMPARSTSRLTDGLGTRWELSDTAIKPYPVCHFIHGAADAAIALHGELGSSQSIAGIRVLLPAPTLPIVAEPAADKRRPQTDYAAKFSAAFVVSTCLVHGRFGLAELEPQALKDPAVLALCERTDCVTDPETAFPAYFSGGVELDLADGRRLSRHVRVNSGAGDRALSVDEASDKFTAAAGMALSPDHAQRARDAILSIDTMRPRVDGRLRSSDRAHPARS